MGIVYLLAPKLTLGQSVEAERFFVACKVELALYVSVSEIQNGTVLQACRLGSGDAIIIFNRLDRQYDPLILGFLADAVRDGADIVSVAITVDSRRPPPPVENQQSFDVTEQLRRRSLSSAQLEVIAAVFSRQLLARLEPTLTNEPMHLFLSYRRIDGEETAGWFGDDMVVRAQGVFRDLMSVRIGQDAQDVIEENLSQSDAVVFLDTPKAGASTWIERELQIALSLGLPIVWVRVGAEAGRSVQRLRPAQRPHFSFPELQMMGGRIPAEAIDAIAHKAFAICREAFASRILGQINHLRRLAVAHGATFDELDKPRLLYTITLPRKGFRYPERPITQVLQFFGRWPTENDRGQIDPCLKKYGYEPHPRHGPYYDAALLLAPVPTRPNKVNQGTPRLCVESSDDYVKFIEGYLVPKKRSPGKKGLIISGAFPDCEPDCQQNLTDSVHAFTRGCLDRQGIVIFGAHPTFQHLIFDMARRRRADDYKTALHMYVSRFFATNEAIDEYAKYASIFPTDSVPGGRDDSLTAMRRAMINDAQAAGIVVIGGKTAAGGHTPGVDEEIALAREADIPVFVVGSVGGRSGQLASEWKSGNAKGNALNSLTAEQNNQLLNTIDYVSLAALVLDSLGW
ncbi:MAG: TIR domain-containing protein [Acidobacteriia bacterium]|nr:TIR domain-containing protein [Terriglobia bacterium]